MPQYPEPEPTFEQWLSAARKGDNESLGRIFAHFREELERRGLSSRASPRLSSGPAFMSKGYFSTPNLKIVSDSNGFPGRKTVDGNCGLFGESGKCCVSRQMPRCRG